MGQGELVQFWISVKDGANRNTAASFIHCLSPTLVFSSLEQPLFSASLEPRTVPGAQEPQKPVEPVNEPPEFQVLLSGCTRYPAQVCLTSKSQLIITMLFCFCYDCRQNVTRTCRGIPFWSCRENGKQARKVTLRDWLGWGAGMDTSK